MNTERLFLILAILGFIAPTLLVIPESIETGNILLYTDPLATMRGMFANRIASIFMIDLLFGVLVFFIWSYLDSRRTQTPHLGWVWFLTLLLGLAGGFPLYLYFREKAIQASSSQPH